MAKLTIQLGATIGKLKRGLADARGELKNWGKRVAKLGKVALAVSAGALAAGLAGLTKRAIVLAAQFQQTRVAFNAMLGDSQKAAALIEALTEFSTKTPFSPEKVQQAARTLLAFGFTAEEVKKSLKPLGDVAAGTGKDFNELAVIFGQIKSAGRLMGQDLLQLINAGFNPLQQISKTTGKSVAELKDEMSKGLITFDQVEQAFVDATSAGGLFNNMMEEQSKTVGGLVSTLKGNFDEFLKTVGAGTTGPLTDMLNKLNDIAVAMNEVAQAGQKAEGGVGGLKITMQEYAKTVNPLLGLLDRFTGALSTSEEQGPVTKEDIRAGRDALDKAKKEEQAAKEDAREQARIAGENAFGAGFEEKGMSIAELRKKVMDEARAKVQAETQERAKADAQAGLSDAISVSKDRAAELEKRIGAAFSPQGEIASSLSRIGGERGIAISRNVPEKQLEELKAMRKGIEVMEDTLKNLNPTFPG